MQSPVVSSHSATRLRIHQRLHSVRHRHSFHMVEQKKPKVSWLRKMVRRSTITGADAEGPTNLEQPGTPHQPEPQEAVATNESLPTARPRPVNVAPPGDKPKVTVESPIESRATTPGVRSSQLAPTSHVDSASVMTIASSSKRNRKSLDTNASTTALAAESLFSWAAEDDVSKSESRTDRSLYEPTKLDSRDVAPVV